MASSMALTLGVSTHVQAYAIAPESAESDRSPTLVRGSPADNELRTPEIRSDRACTSPVDSCTVHRVGFLGRVAGSRPRSPLGETQMSEIGSSVRATTCHVVVSMVFDPGGTVITDQSSSSSISSTCDWPRRGAEPSGLKALISWSRSRGRTVPATWVLDDLACSRCPPPISRPHWRGPREAVASAVPSEGRGVVEIPGPWPLTDRVDLAN